MTTSSPLHVGDVTHGRGEADGTGGFAFHLAGGGGTRSCAADVEGTHGELGTRLADGLRGDDAHRLAGIHQIAASQVAAIAFGAQPPTRVAGQRRAHFHFVDTQLIDQV
jgi:hypothetical protein